MTYPDYLRQLAADHHESGTHATADGLEECDPYAYAVLLVIAGDHEDLNPER